MHTPTPWIKQETIIEGIHGNIVANFQHGEWEYTNAKENMERIVACVNACEPFKDPLTDIPLLKLYGEQEAKLRESCEAALAERDVTIQTLRDRVKEMEAEWIPVENIENTDLVIMSTLPAMPDKWAVKIENEAEAVELQALFPAIKLPSGQTIKKRFISLVAATKNDIIYFSIEQNDKWMWRVNLPRLSNNIEGYTIYTLSQLKELLK
jgi:hypothetical protein